MLVHCVCMESVYLCACVRIGNDLCVGCVWCTNAALLRVQSTYSTNNRFIPSNLWGTQRNREMYLVGPYIK